MIRFNCHGQPFIDPWYEVAIKDWGSLNINQEGQPKIQTDIEMPVLINSNGPRPFKINLNQPINTSVFDELELL